MVILYIVQLCLIKYLRTKRIRRRASQTKVAVQHASPQIGFNLRDLIHSASPKSFFANGHVEASPYFTFKFINNVVFAPKCMFD